MGTQRRDGEICAVCFEALKKRRPRRGAPRTAPRALNRLFGPSKQPLFRFYAGELGSTVKQVTARGSKKCAAPYSLEGMAQFSRK